MWKKISEKEIKVGHRTITSKQFQLPDGSIKNFEVVGRLNSSTVCVLAITSEQNIVIAEQFRPGIEKVLQELPGGKVDEGETPLAAIKRELLEETGFTGNFTYLGKSYSSAYTTNTKHYFIATDCKKVQEPENEPSEFITAKEVTKEDFLTIVQSGDLTDLDGALLGLRYLGNLTFGANSDKRALMEKLSDLEHRQWAHWTNHMLNNMTEENIARWQRQIATPYADLSEKEKERDRKWAKKVLELLGMSID